MERITKTVLMNMCMVYDNDRILVEEKVGKDYKGIIFPGGHVEEREPFAVSIVREIQEETGLTIRNPQVCGVKNWIEEDGTRFIVILYKTDQFEGELRSSAEGRVFWIRQEELKDQNLLWNMMETMEIFLGKGPSEYFMEEHGKDHWDGGLY